MNSSATRVPGWEKAERIPGWFSEAEARILNELCDGLWVEIGCYKGRSTVILAETGHPGYAIDTFLASSHEMKTEDTYVEFLGNMDGYDNVIVIRNDFRTVPYFTIPDEINLLHLDADHSYELTKRAWKLYSRKVEQGGHVAFHDASGGYWPGVEKVIEEIDREEWQEGPAARLLVTFQRL